MAWELEWGNKLEFLKTLQEQGNTVDALETRPRLKPWLADTYRAFQILSASRPMGMGVLGPIPVSEVKAYLDIFEISDFDERESFITMMQALDSIYLKHVNKKQETGTPKPVSKRKRK